MDKQIPRAPGGVNISARSRLLADMACKADEIEAEIKALADQILIRDKQRTALIALMKAQVQEMNR